MTSTTSRNKLAALLLLAGLSEAPLAAPLSARTTPTPRAKPATRRLPTHTFTLGTDHFMLDGKPLQMISGELHYPRIPREAWRSRLKMAKAMGLNTIGTYVFWNAHEPQPGKYDFTGNNDVAAFVKMAQEEGLWVILRPSPYVCAEWEFGGYPYWLQNIPGLKVRSQEPQYVATYKRYLEAVGKQLAPLQVSHGGPILMVQVENEYGSYGADKEYLALNKKLFIDAGFDGLLYTCDPVKDVADGHLPGLLPAVNGTDKPSQIRQLVRSNHSGQGPYYVAEWYPAWFDWWGTTHHTVPASKYTPGLDSVLKAGMSINMYMFHGGTTRAFMNGANYKGDSSHYEPQVSSYDYDAPLDEAGNPTAKFLAFREVIAKYRPAGQPLPPVPAAKPSIALPAMQLTKTVSLLDRLPAPVASAKPLTFEALKQAYGFVLYRATVTGGGSKNLKISDLRDYAVVMVNGKRVGTLDRRLKQESLDVALPAGQVQLDILVENLGRVNFGEYLLQNNKGITKSVSLGGSEVKNWKMYGLPFDQAPTVAKAGTATPAASTGPVLRSGTFTVATPTDTYLDLRQWGKGSVWVNGHNLGRYWAIGPQQTLYVPAEWLKKGANEITVLELLKPQQTTLASLDHAILSDLRP
ncbi:glycoside hydrolase family 35 protein [Hymenobacter negativus]|uniref:Beta-galactosidase n=1 Tax=Hymenobacter negativus TaxID=2795026 RepID=A0ABS3Q8A3_9BACT|nr:glycoside hydrolase family 35 protein [Hymenobacter negativus]MBO2007474.1 beta-galactosidase [Hymenobacter negativus]